MNKQKRLEYMRKHFPKLEVHFQQLENIPCDAVLPTTKHDLLDEMKQMDTVNEYKQEKRKEKLLSDE